MAFPWLRNCSALVSHFELQTLCLFFFFSLQEHDTANPRPFGLLTSGDTGEKWGKKIRRRSRVLRYITLHKDRFHQVASELRNRWNSRRSNRIFLSFVGAASILPSRRNVQKHEYNSFERRQYRGSEVKSRATRNSFVKYKRTRRLQR